MRLNIKERNSLVVLLIPLLAVASCMPDRWSETHANGTRLAADRPECPQVWDSIPLFMNPDPVVAVRPGSATTFVVPATGLAVPGPITDIPEFHDCQRFIEADGKFFGPLHAIFASSVLDSVVSALKWEEVLWTSSSPPTATVNGLTGLVTAITPGTATITGTSTSNASHVITVALNISGSNMSDTMPPVVISGNTLAALQMNPGRSVRLSAAVAARTDSTLAVGQIYTYGNGYPKLGIGPNFSCLYLYFDVNYSLTAKVIPFADTEHSEKACLGVANPQAVVGTILQVVRTVGWQANDYPAVARWDYDTVNSQYHIGIKCGNGWCDVGSAGVTGAFTPSRTYYTGPNALNEEKRVVEIKGWHDRQNLAIDDASGVATPSGIVATVIPNPGFNRNSIGDEYRDRWVLGGYVGMDVFHARPGAVDKYKTKFNFDPVPVKLPLSTMNKLWYCFGTRSACKVRKPPPGKGCNDTWVGMQIKVWWVRIEAATDKREMYRCVTRRHHPGLQSTRFIEPTARWRWIAQDETVWEWCASAACCEIGPDKISGGWF